MAQHLRRNPGILVSGAIAAVAAVVVAFIAFGSGGAAGIELTSARFVPADASVYVAFNTDLESGQWLRTFKLIERMGQDEPFRRLKDAVAEQGGADWEREVRPFLGGDAGLFLRSFATNADNVDGALIVRARDAKRAEEYILDAAPGRARGRTYEGVSYYVLDDGAFARIGDHLILAANVDTLLAVIDVQAGRERSLANSAKFQDLRDDVGDDFVLFVYVNVEPAIRDAGARSDAWREAVSKSGLGDLAFEPFAAVAGATKNGFTFQTLTAGGAGVLEEMLRPRLSKLAAVVPETATVFVSLHGLAQTWDRSIERSRAQIDEALRGEGVDGGLDGLLHEIDAGVDARAVRKLLAEISGETGLALWFPGGPGDDPEVAFLAEVRDENAAIDALDAIFAAAQGARLRIEHVAGREVTIVEGRDGDGDPVAFAVASGVLVAGTVEGVRDFLEPDGRRLKDGTAYRATVAAMPAPLGSHVFVNLEHVVSLFGGRLPGEAGETLEALQGYIVNGVTQGKVSRFNGVVAIKP